MIEKIEVEEAAEKKEEGKKEEGKKEEGKKEEDKKDAPKTDKPTEASPAKKKAKTSKTTQLTVTPTLHKVLTHAEIQALIEVELEMQSKVRFSSQQIWRMSFH